MNGIAKQHETRSVQSARRPAAAIWDLDGLLFDTIPVHIGCWRQTCREEGLDCSDATIKRLSGCSNQVIGRALLQPQLECLSDEKLEEMVERKQALFTERFARDIRLHAGVREWLDGFAARGYRQAVASSAAMRHIEMAVSGVGIESLFQAILSAEVHVGRGKPDPDIFLLASSRLNVEPAHCIVLEDAEVGVRAAKTAGMYCIAVTNTQPAEVLAAADLVVGSLADVSPEVCDRWMGLA